MKAGVVAPNSCLVTSLRSCTPGHESQSRGRIVLRQSTLHETINSENNAHIKQDNNPYATPVNARNSFLYNTVYTFSNSSLSLIHICRCRRYAVCRSRWSPYH
eukprot:TRINITY_DN11862_c0_g1_i5.p1 TRINITY_DN11862_c0_g1~~TRINITY_DN11862_c0_g1_i5.p1  ORF type:complete len:103 (+),score=6.56 TRINITY_DN11862_c0_g1_i5:116-424(+)